MDEYKLNRKQLEVLKLLAEGLGNVEIADRLNVSKHTVRNRLSRIYYKLDVFNDRSAIAYYYQKLK